MGVASLGYIENIKTVKRAAGIQAMVTHSWETGPYAQMIAIASHYFLYNIGPKNELLEFINNELNEQYFIVDRRCSIKNTFASIFKESEYEDIIEPCKMTAESTSYHSLYAVLAHDNLVDMLTHCINVGGDTDSLGAIAMALGSASNEVVNNLPQHLYDTLENGPSGRNSIIGFQKSIDNVFFPRTHIAIASKG